MHCKQNKIRFVSSLKSVVCIVKLKIAIQIKCNDKIKNKSIQNWKSQIVRIPFVIAAKRGHFVRGYTRVCGCVWKVRCGMSIHRYSRCIHLRLEWFRFWLIYSHWCHRCRVVVSHVVHHQHTDTVYSWLCAGFVWTMKTGRICGRNIHIMCIHNFSPLNQCSRSF